MDALTRGVQDLTEAVAVLRLDLLWELLLAAIFGGLIGWDREASGKPAGLRTNMLICIGATLIADLSVRFPGLAVSDLVRADPARLVAQVVSGIGFLGAGTIIQARGNVTGLTTAATLWVVAAIGIGVGSGHYVEAAGTTALVLLTLVPLGMLERHFQRKRRGRQIWMEIARSPSALETLEGILERHGLSVRSRTVERRGDDRLALSLDLEGDERVFVGLRQELVERPEVLLLRLDW